MSRAISLQFLYDGGFRIITRESVKNIHGRVDHWPIAIEGGGKLGFGVITRRGDQYPSNLQAIPTREVEVPLVMTGDSHHSAGSIRGDDEVASIDRNLLPA